MKKGNKKFLKMFLAPSVILLSSTFASLAASCNGDKNAQKTKTAFKLQLLHFSDIDSGGNIIENVKDFSKLLDFFRSSMPDNSLVVSTGDNYIAGPEFNAAGDNLFVDALHPEAQIQMPGYVHMEWLNQLGVQVSAIGNHDLDLGTETFADLVNGKEKSGKYSWQGAQFPFVGANANLSTDEDVKDLVTEGGQDVKDIKGKVAPSAVATVGREKIGIVGAVYPLLTQITSPGNITFSPSGFEKFLNPDGTPTPEMKELAGILQKEVDKLTAKGINKVIVLSHLQSIANEIALAPLLKNVDIVVAGGSNTIFKDENDALRDADIQLTVKPYPVWTTSNETHQPVAVVNTAADYRYLGRFVADFDANGVLIKDKYDPEVSGAFAATHSVVDKYAKYVAADPEVVKLANGIYDVLKTKRTRILGYTKVFLNGERSSVRTKETNFGDLLADAELNYAEALYTTNHINGVITNGGGLRASIGSAVVPPGGDGSKINYNPPKKDEGIPGTEDFAITQLDIETALKFNNSLNIVELTGGQLKVVFEKALEGRDGKIAGQKGSFAQIAGFQVKYDESKPAYVTPDYDSGGKKWADKTQSEKDPIIAKAWSLTNGGRVVDLTLTHPESGTDIKLVENGTLNNTYKDTVFRVVMPSFIAGGGDGYPTKTLDASKITSLKTLTEPSTTGEYANPIFTNPDNPSIPYVGKEQRALEVYLRKLYGTLDKAYNIKDKVDGGPSDTRIVRI